MTTPLASTGIAAALSGFKSGEDGKSLIFPVYEPAGGRGKFELELPQGWIEDATVSILEEPMDRAARPDLRPFELRSWKLVRS